MGDTSGSYWEGVQILLSSSVSLILEAALYGPQEGPYL